eukprot:s4402_g1.t1
MHMRALAAHTRIVVHCMQISSVLSFALSSAVVMLAAYVQSHLLLGLDKSALLCTALTLADFVYTESFSVWRRVH